MRVLIDECAPKALKVFLAKRGHESRTVQEAGWAGKQNGELLKLAESISTCSLRLIPTYGTNRTWKSAESPL